MELETKTDRQLETRDESRQTSGKGDENNQTD